METVKEKLNLNISYHEYLSRLSLPADVPLKEFRNRSTGKIELFFTVVAQFLNFQLVIEFHVAKKRSVKRSEQSVYLV